MTLPNLYKWIFNCQHMYRTYCTGVLYMYTHLVHIQYIIMYMYNITFLWDTNQYTMYMCVLTCTCVHAYKSLDNKSISFLMVCRWEA